MITERAPYTVRCAGLDPEPAVFRENAAARSYALGIANRENVQCAITDRFGQSELIVRSGPVDPRRREYDPYRDRPFFHPNPEHPRSRKRFLRNEPQAWTPGMGPSQTLIRPSDFHGMNNARSLLADFGPSMILLGFVLYVSRDRDMLMGLSAEEDELPFYSPSQRASWIPRRPPAEQTILKLPTSRPRTPSSTYPSYVNGQSRNMAALKRRHAARKLYGSAVLVGQAAGSMRKLSSDTKNPRFQQESSRLQNMSNSLMSRANDYDADFVRKKLS